MKNLIKKRGESRMRKKIRKIFLLVVTTHTNDDETDKANVTWTEHVESKICFVNFESTTQ